MDLFDQLVDEALQQRQDLAPLRIVVEKELLHHDILRVLSSTGLLTKLTFIGGTCLRACYGSNRLSEDLDFTGGADFTKERLTAMAKTLIDSLHAKYGLSVEVSEPVRESGNVDTWKIKIQTRPDRKDMPAQRINIDVCAIPSYESQPMMLLNPYRIDMGTDGLLIQAESREEIFTDKLVAFALRPNRIKNRDLWDMAWLHQQAVKPQFALLPDKLKDHGCTTDAFIQLFNQRVKMLVSHPEVAREFRDEMRRFLPADIVSQTVEQDAFWGFLTRLMLDLDDVIVRVLTGERPDQGFSM